MQKENQIESERFLSDFLECKRGLNSCSSAYWRAVTILTADNSCTIVNNLLKQDKLSNILLKYQRLKFSDSTRFETIAS